MATPDSGSVDELAVIFARMSGLLLTDQTVQTAVATVTSLAAETMAGSAGSGVSLLDAERRRTTWAATDGLVEQLDALQYELDEGPCLTAWLDNAVVSAGRLDTERRWPSWSRRAAEMGMRSVLSSPLISGAETIGAIKVYSGTVDAYDEKDQDVLRRLADQAAIFVSNVLAVRSAESLSEALKQTLRTRDDLAMARGIVMAVRGLGIEDANRHLMAEAQRLRLPIRDVATRVIAVPREA